MLQIFGEQPLAVSHEGGGQNNIVNTIAAMMTSKHHPKSSHIGDILSLEVRNAIAVAL